MHGWMLFLLKIGRWITKKKFAATIPSAIWTKQYASIKELCYIHMAARFSCLHDRFSSFKATEIIGLSCFFSDSGFIAIIFVILYLDPDLHLLVQWLTINLQRDVLGGVVGVWFTDLNGTCTLYFSRYCLEKVALKIRCVI